VLPIQANVSRSQQTESEFSALWALHFFDMPHFKSSPDFDGFAGCLGLCDIAANHRMNIFDSKIEVYLVMGM